MKNGDLWKRIDAALQIHDVRCRTCRFDDRHDLNRTNHENSNRNRSYQPTASAAKPTLAGPHFSMVAASRIRATQVTEVRQQARLPQTGCEIRQPDENTVAIGRLRNRLPRFVFRPFIGVARRTASALQVLADSLDPGVLPAGLPEAAAEPHLT